MKRLQIRGGFAAACEGSTAVEFGMVLPALMALSVGGLYTALVVYSAAGLHSAVEQAARCYSVNSSQCSGAPATQAYAQSQYYGINTPSFVAGTAACGHQVTGTVTIGVTAVVSTLTIPLSASACFP